MQRCIHSDVHINLIHNKEVFGKCTAVEDWLNNLWHIHMTESHNTFIDIGNTYNKL
jgi:hypothetical protein